MTALSIGATGGLVRSLFPGVLACAVVAVAATFSEPVRAGRGPFLVGVLSDSLGLATAMTVIPVFGALAALFFLLASRSYEADRQHVAAVPVDAEPEASAGTTPTSVA